MNLLQHLAACTPEGMSGQEWQARLELAACYRIFEHLGWTEAIFNHISLRIDEQDQTACLINPFGLNYGEVTAHNLVKINLAGDKLSPSVHRVNRAGFVIHSAVHAARADAHCVIHTHTDTAMAVACKADGLRCDNFYSASLAGQVAYHDFEGITTDLDEQGRLVESLGSRSYLVLRNHGVLVVGGHVPEALMRYWLLQRACDIQAMADGMRGDNVVIPDSVLARIPAQEQAMRSGAAARRGQMFFDAMLRRTGVAADALRGSQELAGRAGAR